MGLPLKYTLRNLRRRRLRTSLTVLGIALVIAAAVIMMAYSRGLVHAMRNNGEADNVIVLSRRASDREFSSFKSSQFDILASVLMDDVVWYPVAPPEEEGDEPETIDLVAPFISTTPGIRVPSAGDTDDTPARRGLVQGVDVERAYFLHSAWRLVDGRLLDLGDERAALVGALAWARLGLDKDDLKVGSTIVFRGEEWPVVGLFEAPGTTADGEIWVPISELQAVLNRVDHSYAVLKAQDEAGAAKIVEYVNRSDQMELRAVLETQYYRGFAETFDTLALIGGVMALIITLGGVMVGLNTMYTAVAGRIREVGMLQVQGFSKRAVMGAFLRESLLIALLGGVLGCALGSLVNGMPMKVTMGVFVFRVDALVIGAGMLLALLIGLVGAWIPARRALRLRMVDAMRYA